MAADGCDHPPLRVAGRAHKQGVIGLVDFSVLEIRHEEPQGLFGLGNQQHPRSVLVQAVNYPGAEGVGSGQ